MNEVIESIRADLDFYLRLCQRYGVNPNTDLVTGMIDPYCAQADTLRTRAAHDEYVLKSVKTDAPPVR